MEDKLKDKLLKLYELAKRGYKGERSAAETMLYKLLDKHNLSIEDIEDSELINRYYKYTTKESRTIISQVIYKIVGDRPSYRIIGMKEIEVKATDYEHVQILEEIDFHLENFNLEKKEILRTLASAYVQKHRLFSENSNHDRVKSIKHSAEELLKITNMVGALSNRTYTKKLNQ